MPEANIIEIFVDPETNALYLCIPASSQLFELDLGKEQDFSPYDKLRLLGQFNLDEESACASCPVSGDVCRDCDEG